MTEEAVLEQQSWVPPQFKWPPVMQDAEFHAVSNMIGNFDQDTQNKEQSIKKGNVKFCDCCGMIEHEYQLATCSSDLNTVENLGVTALLYFQFVKQMGFLMLSNFIVYSLYSIITNVLQQKFNNITDIAICLKNGSCSIVILLGIASKVKEESPPVTLIVQAWLTVVVVIVWTVQLIYSRRRFKAVGQMLESRLVSPSHFTAMLYGMPQQNYTEKYVKDLIKNFYDSFNIKNFPMEVAKVSIAYNIQEFSNQHQEFLEWMRQKREIDIHLHAKGDLPKGIIEQDVRDLDERIKSRGQQLQVLKKNVTSQNLKTGLYCLVVFNTRTMLVDFLRRTKKSFFSQYVLDPIVHFFCCNNAPLRNLLIMNGNIINTRRAPQPADINWGNSSFSISGVYGRALVSWLISLILLGVSFSVIYGLSLAQAGYSGKNKLYISLLISIVVAVINALLRTVIQIFTNLERAFTKAELNGSLALKTIIAQLMNLILVLVIVGYFIKQKDNHIQVYKVQGLIEDVFILCITTTLLPFFMSYFVDTELIIRCFKKCVYRSQIENNECLMTQRELNVAMQNSHFYVAQQYVVVSVIVLFCSFFSSIQPIACALATVGLFLLYWVKKHLLLSRYSRPEHFGKSINSSVMGLIDFAPVFFAFGSLMGMNLFRSYTQTLIPNLVAVGLSCINIFIPFDSIYQNCCGNDSNLGQQVSYEESKLTFIDDYDRSNPVTHDKALMEHFSNLKASSSTTQETKQLIKELQKNASPTAKMIPNAQPRMGPFVYPGMVPGMQYGMRPNMYPPVYPGMWHPGIMPMRPMMPIYPQPRPPVQPRPQAQPQPIIQQKVQQKVQSGQQSQSRISQNSIVPSQQNPQPQPQPQLQPLIQPFQPLPSYQPHQPYQQSFYPPINFQYGNYSYPYRR